MNHDMTSSMSYERPNYDVLDRALAVHDADMGPSEAQGLLTGLLCGAGNIPLSAWAQQVFETVSEAGPQPWGEDQECGPLLQGVYQATLDGLYDEELGFALLLPDDDRELAVRLEELAAWSQGFMAGLGMGGERDWDALSDDFNEAMRDLSQISRISNEGGGEEDEQAWAEVTEYLRMAVLLIHAELQASSAPLPSPDQPAAIH